MRSRFLLILVLLAVSACGVSRVYAQCQLAKVPSPDPAYNAFGYQVAGDGHLFAASTYLQDDQPGVTVWMLRRVGLTLVNEGQLVPDPPTPQSTGFDRVLLSVSGDRVAVGDYQYSTLPDLSSSNNRGRVIIFDKIAGIWTQTAILPGTVDNGAFGSSVALSGSTLVVGAPSTGALRGSAYVYRFDGTTWNLTQTIDNPATTMTNFGAGMAIRGQILLVGAPNSGFGGPGGDSSRAYVFVDGPGGFVLDGTLAPAGAPPGPMTSGFGTVVAIDGDVAVVGAPQEDFLNGAAYLFTRDSSGWSLVSRLSTPGGGSFVTFGGALALRARDGTTPGVMIIGSEGDSVFANTSGAVFLYEDSGGGFEYTTDLRRDDVNEGDRFGCALALCGDTVLIGARSSQPYCQSGGDCMDGSVYLFGGFVPGCAPDGTPDLCAIKAGAPDANGNDIPDSCEQPSGGTCCRGATCNASISQTDCSGTGTAGAMYAAASSCNAGGSTSMPCCYGDYNKAGGITVQDIFDFLADWFAGSAYANVGGDGTAGPLAVQNIFDFLAAWFAGGC